MRFFSWLARLRSERDKALEIGGEFLEEGAKSAGSRGGTKEPAADLSAYLVKGKAAVDLIERVRIKMAIGGEVGRQRVEVIANRLCADILPGGVP